jgi:hypothetical protein
MKLINFFRDRYRSLLNNQNDSKNELIHPRFEVSNEDAVKQTKVSNSLLFLMYSKENETLFV